jgi:gliding motility-associated-like protein
MNRPKLSHFLVYLIFWTVLIIPNGLQAQVAQPAITHPHHDPAVLAAAAESSKIFIQGTGVKVDQILFAAIPARDKKAFLKFLGPQISYDKRELAEKIYEKEIIHKEQLTAYLNLIKQKYSGLYSEFLNQREQEQRQPVPFEPGRGPGQPCQNMDFESQSTFAWVGSYGSGCDPNAIAGMNTLGLNSATGQHTIMTAGTDPNVPAISCVMPGGSASLRLGDNGGGGNYAARISQTFQVQAASPYFTYNYAVVLEDAGHVLAEQPYFRIRMYDGGGGLISCATLDVDATNAPGLTTSGGIKYKNWTQVVIPLTAYVGQNVTIEFTTADCNNGAPSGGSHDGYAYIDCSCVPPQIFTSSPTICGGTSINVTAPSGLSSYSWTGPGIVGANNTQSIVVNQAGTYTVTMVTSTTPPNIPCTFSLDTIIPGNPSNPVAQFSSDVVCVGGTTQFTDLSTPAGISSWAWDFDANGTTDATTQNPGHIFPAAGTYPVTLIVSLGGCTDNFTGNVTVNAGTAPVIDPAGPFCSTAASVTLTSNIAGGTWAGPGITNATAGTFDPSVAAIGNNTITYTTTGACAGTTSSIIVVNGQPLSDAGADLTICTGGTGTIGTAATAGFTYSWSPATGLSSTTSSSPSVTLTNVTPAPISTTYTVTTTNAGCTSTDEVLVIVNPAATAYAGPDQTVCAGSTVSLAGSVGGSAIAATWGGGSGSYSPSNNDLNAVYTPSAAEEAAGSVTLTLVSNDPAGPCPVATSTMTITIDPIAVIDAGPDQIICIGSNANLAAIPSGAATGGTWSGGGGAFVPGPTDPNAVYTPSAAEEAAGTVLLTFTTNDPAGPCAAATDEVLITISPLPVADAGADQTICSGGSVTLAGILSGSATTGTWSGGAGTFTPDAFTMNASYTPSAAEAASGSVTLTLTTNDPVGPCVADSDVMTITINPGPQVSAGPDQTICIGSDVILAGTIGGTASSAIWTGGTGTFLPDAATPGATYSPSAAEAAAGTVTLTFTTDDPVGPCSSVNDQVVITINALPVANAGTSQSVCSGSPITLNGSVSGSASSGSWSGGAGSFSPNNSTLNAVYTPTAAEYISGSVTLTLTTNDPAGPCSAVSSTVTHYFYLNPVIDFTVDLPDGCPPHCASFSDLSTIGGGDNIVSWSWSFGDGSPASTLQNPSHCFTATGFYDITLTATSNNGCSSSMTETQMVQVFPVPVAAFTPNPSAGDVLDPHITMINQSSNDVTSWFWSFGDGDSLSPFTANPTHTYPDAVSSSYDVELIVMNSYGCMDTVMHPVYIGPEFTFFIPNAFTPNGDGINDFFFGSGIGIIEYDIWIFDRWGNMIWHGDDLQDRWNGVANGGKEQAQQDVYVWKVKLKDVFTKGHNYMGTVTLVK